MPEVKEDILVHQEERQEYSHSEIMVIMAALMLAMLLAALDQTIVSTALPRIVGDLHGLNRLSWVVTAYLLTSTISTPLYGKISDLYGRKKIFQGAIIIFILGSILSGLSQNMNELIAFRAIQGLGGGGLITLALTVIGDIVTPRQRGRYQGYIGAVFGFSSIIGPLLGGLFTDHLSWRWIFYINIPLGLVALFAIATRLHLPKRRTEHKIDVVGATLLSGSIVSLLLVTVWGGTTYAWGSSIILSLLAAGVVLLGAFTFWERRVPEPILPPYLFKNDIFTTSVILAFLAGLLMFGAVIFLPEYQQLVRGYSATKSGLYLTPLVFALLFTSILSGRLISKWGKYRIFPIIGTILVTIGYWLFSHVTLTTSQLTLSLWMVVLGLGVGMFMQVVTLAVQNAVDRKDLGAASSSTVFFRSLGSSFGTSLFGTILTNRLVYNLPKELPNSPAATHINVATLQGGTQALDRLPPTIRHGVLEAFVKSFHTIYLWGIPFAILSIGVAFMLREKPLRSSAQAMAEGEGLELQHSET